MGDSVVVRPRIAPVGWGDGLRTLALSVAGLSAVAGLYMLAAALLLSQVGQRTWAPLAVQALMLPLIAVLVLKRVSWLELSEQGIRFGSWLERKRLVPWSEVRSVRPASSAEVIVRGWLWPPVPPREATPTLSSEGHYRIETTRGVRYFPPLVEGELVEALARWAPHTLTDPATSWALPRLA